MLSVLIWKTHRRKTKLLEVDLLLLLRLLLVVVVVAAN
jgi:hypothetical protein